MRAHNRPVEEKSEVNIIHVHYFISEKKIIMIFVSQTTGTHRAEKHLLLVTQELSIYRAEVDESKCQVQRHFVEGELSKDTRVFPGRCSRSRLP